MRRLIIGAAVALAAFVALPQVRIVSLGRNGDLTWTNLAGAGSVAPVYRIESAGSVTGPWSELALVTNQTSVTTTNASADPFALFYRVAWTNGEVWSYRGYDSAGLAVTGRLYIASPFVPWVKGAWSFAHARSNANSNHRTGHGSLSGALQEPFVNPMLRVDCLTRVFDEGEFWLDGLPPTNNSWSGVWRWRGGIWAYMTNGPFTAEKVTNGQ